MADRITASEIAVAPHGPHTISAASEKGATDFPSCSQGAIPMTAIVPSTWSSIAMLMPRMVERGMGLNPQPFRPARTACHLTLSRLNQIRLLPSADRNVLDLAQ